MSDQYFQFFLKEMPIVHKVYFFSIPDALKFKEISNLDHSYLVFIFIHATCIICRKTFKEKEREKNILFLAY